MLFFLDLYFVVQSRPFKGNHFQACQPPGIKGFSEVGILSFMNFQRLDRTSDFESTLSWRKGYEKLWQAPLSLRSNYLCVHAVHDKVYCHKM